MRKFLIIFAFLFAGAPAAQAVTNNTYNFQSWNPTTNDTGDNGSKLAAACTAIGTGSLYIPVGIYRLATNESIPSTIRLLPEPGALFDIASGHTLTHNGGILAASSQQLFKFDSTSTTPVVFGSNTNIPVVYPTWFGAKHDGSTDDTNAWSATTLSIASNGGTICAPPGTYMINADYASGGSIDLPSNTDLRLDPAAVLQAKPNGLNNSAVVFVHAGHGNVTIRGGTIIGERATHTGPSSDQAGMGIDVLGASQVLIADTYIHDCNGDGIYLGASTQPYCQDVTIRGVISDNNRRQGMSVVGSKHLVVQGCAFTNTNGHSPQAGVDLEPNTTEPIEDVTFSGCRFNGNTGNGVACNNTSTIKRITFTNCFANSNVLTGFQLAGTDIAISNSVANSNTQKGISLGGVGISTIGCICDGNTQEGIRVPGSGTSILIANNTVTSDGGTAGIYLSGVTYSAVRGNTCIGNVVGIDVGATSDSVSITGNLVQSSTGSGINATMTASSITGNTLIANAGIGIQLGSGSNGTLINGNRVSASGQRGIYTSTSNDGTMTGNYVESSNTSNSTFSNYCINGNNWLFSGNTSRAGSLTHKPKYGLEILVNATGNRVGTNDLHDTAYVTSDYIDGGTATRGIPQAAAPATGAWLLGETVDNSAPAPLAPFGWIDTAAGTPGTWAVRFYLPGLEQTITGATGTVSDTTATAIVNRAGVVTVTLPTSAYPAGVPLTTQNGDGNCSATNIYSFSAGSGTTLAGTPTMDAPYASITWRKDSSNVWHAN